MSVLREPLVHFVIGGALLFALYAAVAEPEQAPERVVVSEEQVERLASSFQRTWMRPPTATELAGLVDDYVTEEVLYREALALGLDRDDLIVRRRMRQKMEFMHDGLVELAEPDDAALQAHLEARSETFRVPDRVSFEQLYLDPARDGDVATRAHQWLDRLRADADASALGDPTLLPRTMEGASPREISGTFGDDFVAALAELESGVWGGPLESAYGQHLVRIVDRVPGRVPALADIRADVEEDWRVAQAAAGRKRFYQEIRERYDVRVDMPVAETVETP